MLWFFLKNNNGPNAVSAYGRHVECSAVVLMEWDGTIGLPWEEFPLKVLIVFPCILNTGGGSKKIE